MSKLLDVSVSQGTKIVEVFSAEPVTGILKGDIIFITGDVQPFTIDYAEVEDVTNRKLIHLLTNWTAASATNTTATWLEQVPKLEEARLTLQETNDRYAARIDNISKFTLDMGQVVMPARNAAQQDVTLDTLPQIASDLSALTTAAQAALNNATGASDALDLLEADIVQANTDLSNVSSTLADTIAAKNLAQEYATQSYNVNVSGTSDYSALHYAEAANTSRALAETARAGAEAAETRLDGLETNVQSLHDNVVLYATQPVDVEISPGVYSSKHYAAKAQESALAAQDAVSSVTASLYFVGGFDASSGNPPPTPTGNGNPFYKVTVAGVVGGIDYAPNDNIIWDGTNSVWFKVDNTESVVSVNGQSGIVSISIADIPGLQAALDDKVSLSTFNTQISTINDSITDIEQELTRVKTMAMIGIWSVIHGS